MKEISVKIPGKCILFGEHAVVHGYPAIAAAISLYSKCIIKKISEPLFILKLHDFNLEYSSNNFVEIACKVKQSYPQLFLGLEILSKKHNLSYKNIAITLTSELWPSSGLGSSASTSLALISGLVQFYALNYTKNMISEIAYQMEKIVHGKPSGIDNSICIYGGIISYTQGNIEFLPIPKDISILIIYTGQIHDTKKAIANVDLQMQKEPEKTQKVFKKIGSISEKARYYLKEQDFVKIFPLIEKNQEYLTKLNLSTPNIQKIIHIANEHSFNHIKITGAGMGGCLIAIDSKDRLLQLQILLEKNKIQSKLCSIVSNRQKVSDFYE